MAAKFDDFDYRVRFILDAYDQFRSSGDRTIYVNALRLECIRSMGDYLKSIPTYDAWLERKGKHSPNKVLAAIRELIPDDSD